MARRINPTRITDKASRTKRLAELSIAALQINFSLIPETLGAKCTRLVKEYHAVQGYACLPDLLWSSDARELLNKNRELRRLFKLASKIRSSQHANDLLTSIAVVIIGLEVLATDFAGWGTRFPDAKRSAENVPGIIPLRSRGLLMERYIHHSFDIGRRAARLLEPPNDDGS